MALWFILLTSSFIIFGNSGYSYGETITETETYELGPITMVMENLTQVAVNISDEISVQLQSRIERTVTDLTGDIEVLVGNSMEELWSMVYRADKLITTNNCNPTWNLNEFIDQTGQQLTECTKNMRETIASFRTDGNMIVGNVQTFVQQIAQLPVVCQLLNASPLNLSFVSGTNCFVQRIANINRDMSLELNRAGVMLVSTRQLSQKLMPGAELCTANVIAQAERDVNQAVANCK